MSQPDDRAARAREREVTVRTCALSRPVDGQDTWRDQKRYLWMLGLIVPLLPTTPTRPPVPDG
ncbi:hypothetical protein ACVGOW_27615 [Pseudonocardia saturnea]